MAAGEGGVEGEDEVALLRLDDGARLGRRPVEQIAGAAGALGQQAFEEVLEVAALGGALRAFLGPGARGGFQRGDALVELVETLGHLAAELEERRAQAGGIQEDRQLAAVALEVGAEERLDAADGAVALRLVEELIGEGTELAAVAQEGFERAREAPVAVGEVLAQELVQGGGRLRVGVLRLAQEDGELGPHRVDVHGDAGIHEGGHADPEGALHEAGALLGGALGDEGGEAGVDEDQAIDHDAIALDRDAGARGGGGGARRRGDRRQAGGRRARNRQATGGDWKADDVGGGVHAPDSGGGLCQLACHDAGGGTHVPGRPSARISLGSRLESNPSYSESTARM